MGNKKVHEQVSDKEFLNHWRWIVVNSSAGKDSQTALHNIVTRCDAAGVSRDRIVVCHCDLKRMEWDGVIKLVQEQANHYGLRLEIVKYRNKGGEELSLLDAVKRRGKWPDNRNRYCTSDFKRGPGGRVITKLFRESPGPILNVFGFRAEESPARAKKKQFVRNDRLSTTTREVWDYCPILDWTREEVWESIRKSGVPYHTAYDLGMARLSCCLCIFAPRDALLIAGRANPELLDEYCKVEEEIGHDFQHKKPIREIRDAIAAGEQPKSHHTDAWNM
jgi:3'-phosphoadenosine 5'-phosphosulfate sulfotransferase (PAPS reductase)/FAD synthetase